MAKVRRSVLKLYTLTPQMFSINILCFKSNFSFKGDCNTGASVDSTRGIDLFIPRIVLWGIQYHGTPAVIHVLAKVMNKRKLMHQPVSLSSDILCRPSSLCLSLSLSHSLSVCLSVCRTLAFS